MSQATPAAIRPARPEDMPAIAAIYGRAVETGTASFELEPPDAGEMARRHDALVAAGYPYLVAETGGALAGYAYAGPYRPRPAYRWTVENSVYVAETAQGRGIGRALLAALIEETTRRSFRQMIAVIGGTDHAPSLRLHERLGFSRAGTLEAVGFKHGRWLGSVLMQRPLGAGAGTPPDAP